MRQLHLAGTSWLVQDEPIDERHLRGEHRPARDDRSPPGLMHGQARRGHLWNHDDVAHYDARTHVSEIDGQRIVRFHPQRGGVDKDVITGSYADPIETAIPR